MSAIVIVLLVALWGAVLMPGLIRARRDVSPVASIDRFNRSMHLLARTGGGAGLSTEPHLQPTQPPFPATGPVGLANVSDFEVPMLRQDSEPAVNNGSGPARRAAGAQRSRGGRHRAASPGQRAAEAFRRARSVSGDLEPTAPPPAGSVVARRRAVLATLVGVTASGAVLTPLTEVLGTVVLGLGLVLLVAYLGALWHIQQTEEVRRRVRHLDHGWETEPQVVEAVGDRG